ncbi:MAG: hypothetical protein Q8R69_24935 [Telluria sp.]|nr:hypothetical protein [Telluria sp.]
MNTFSPSDAVPQDPLSKRADVHIQVNLDSLAGELQRSVQRITYLVAAGLQSPVDVDPDKLLIESQGVRLQFIQGYAWSETQAKPAYEDWVLGNGFRDAIEAVSTFLESVRQVLAIWRLGKRQSMGEQLTGGLWNEQFGDAARRFHRLGFPDKIAMLETEFSAKLDPALQQQILSANVARNCLVHRGGIVSERDLNTETALEIGWTRMALMLEDEDGQKELVIGRVIEKASSLLLQHQRRSKTFKLGERISFTTTEFVEICWTLFIYSLAWSQKLSEQGLQLGFVKPKPQQNSGPT